jgi:cystathionine beta-lyase/cystathionine gamma-synthase
LVSGVVIGNSEWIKKLKKNARDLGCTTNDFTAFLLSRGLKTLEIRIQRQNYNAQNIAEFFEGNRKITKVYYPGLKSNPQYELAKSFMSGFGGMVSIEVDMNKAEIDKSLKKLKYFTRAVSLGGVESLVCLPCETSHSYLSKERREKLGIKDNLVRVSVGIENVEDLLEDWEEALK